MRQAQRDIVAMRRGFLRCAGLIVHLEELERNGIIDDIMKNECCGQTPRTWRVFQGSFPVCLAGVGSAAAPGAAAVAEALHMHPT